MSLIFHSGHTLEQSSSQNTVCPQLQLLQPTSGLSSCLSSYTELCASGWRNNATTGFCMPSDLPGWVRASPGPCHVTSACSPGALQSRPFSAVGCLSSDRQVHRDKVAHVSPQCVCPVLTLPARVESVSDLAASRFPLETIRS